MRTSLIVLPYFPNVAHMVAISQSEKLLIEKWDNYTKQTYRNRAKILGSNGLLNLTIPVLHSQKERSFYRDVKIKNEEKWQLNHWRSIGTAYNSSPFFEFYKDELIPLYEKTFNYLFDFNSECLETLLALINLKIDTQNTNEFESNVAPIQDLRLLSIAKKEPNFQFDEYTQVFEDRFGFMSNLSSLDLLFNEGPNSINYLQNQKVPAI